MREYPSGTNQCQWIADGAPSCAGLSQNCSGGGNGNPDTDNDGIADSADNCPNDINVDQADNDNDGIGNVCDSTPNGSFTCTDITSSNYAHVQASRATTNGFYTFSIGSGENMGFYNIYSSTTLAETSANYYEIGSCP